MNTVYEIRGNLVYKIETWDDGGRIESIVGNTVQANPVDGGSNIEVFEVDHYDIKEFVSFVEDDDEEKTQFNALVASRIEYWQTEGSAA